jgi:hypothetical protein
MTANSDAALLLQHRQAVAELREQLSMALSRIDELERQLEARRRAEAATSRRHRPTPTATTRAEHQEANTAAERRRMAEDDPRR